MTRQSTITACDQDAIQALHDVEWRSTFTLDQQIARAREEMGEFKWLRLNELWEKEL